MKNSAHKTATNCMDNEQKKKTNHKERRERKIPKILEAFQAVKRIFNIDVYNYESKKDDSEINAYSVITTCNSVSENNSNAFQSNRRMRQQTPELVPVPDSDFQNSSLKNDLQQRQSNDNAVPENRIINQGRSNFEVTVFTTSERSDKLKKQKSTPKKSKKEKDAPTNKTSNKTKPYFICFKCENLVPRAIGISCQKLKCNECFRSNQLYHSEEFLMIHKAKSHYMSEDQKNSETDNTRKEVSTTDKSDESKYYEIDVVRKAPSPIEKPKNYKKNKSRKNKHKSKNSIASKFRDDIASKIAKLIRRGSTSSSGGQRSNSNKHKPKHIPFEWLNDDECDTTDTSMPSPCTLSSVAKIYAVRANDARRKPEKVKTNEAKRYELMKRKNKIITENDNNVEKAATKYLSVGDGVNMTKEKFVSMNFLCDHPSVDKKRLAITNNIKLRVVNSSNSEEQNKYVEAKTRTIPWKTCEKLTVNNSKSQPSKVSSVAYKEQGKEKRAARPKEDIRAMRNVNNSEITVLNEEKATFTKSASVSDRNHNNRCLMPFPHQTAPGKHFPQRNWEQPPLPAPVNEEIRPNFRPPHFACSHLQSQIPSQFRSTTKPPFLNEQFCQGSLTPTLYNYNHRQCLCQNTGNVPKLPWSIMARRMETFKKINDPPKLKYSHIGNSPTPSMERNQETPPNRNIHVYPLKSNQTMSKKSCQRQLQQSDDFHKTLNLGNDQGQLPQRNTSGVVSNIPVMPVNQYIDVLNTKDQIVSRRMSNFHRARQLANNINQQFPGFMT